jgi:hypothetical protein
MEFPLLNILDEGNVIGGMPVAAVVDGVEWNDVQSMVDGLHHLLNFKNNYLL